MIKVENLSCCWSKKYKEDQDKCGAADTFTLRSSSVSLDNIVCRVPRVSHTLHVTLTEVNKQT